MLVLGIYMKKKVPTALKTKFEIRFRSSQKHQRDGAIIPNCELVTFLLKTRSLEDSIADGNADIMKCIQAPSKTLIKYIGVF